MTKRVRDRSEPILDDDAVRRVIYPIQHPDLWAMYKAHIGVFWTCEEIDFEHDRRDFEALTVEEQRTLKSVLAFFAVADGIVMDNLGERFCAEVKVPEAQYFYKVQDMMESIHAECYALQIETLVADPSEKLRLLNGVETMPHVRRKAAFAQKYMDPSLPFGERLIAFACVEGILFSASFAIIYAFKERGTLKGLTVSNELISRDEGLHTKFATLLFGKLQHPPDSDTLRSIVKEAVAVECEFVDHTLATPVRGLTKETMRTYVQVVADHLLGMFGQKKIFFAHNPLCFMDKLGLRTKTNFFETTPVEYQRADEPTNFKFVTEF